MTQPGGQQPWTRPSQAPPDREFFDALFARWEKAQIAHEDRTRKMLTRLMLTFWLLGVLVAMLAFSL